MSLLKKTATVLIASVLLTGCAKQKKKLVMAEVNPPDSVAAQMDVYFANEVNRLTNGDITIEVNTSAVLGDEHTVVNEMMTTKNIDLARVSLMNLASIGAEKSTVMTIPYVFNNRDHFWKFAGSEAATEILTELSTQPNGIRGLFLAEEGFRHFFATKPLNSIEDLSGLKIRTTSDPALNAIIKDLGSEAVQVPFYDVIKEMIVGTVDAAEQPLVNYKSNYFDSVAPNIILDGHTIGVIEVVITNKAWNELSNTQQLAFLKAGENAAAYSREICEKREMLTVESLKATGVNIVEVKDKTPWKNLCAETIQKQAKKDIELYNKIIDMGN